MAWAFNLSLLSGRLTAKPELKQTEGGKFVTAFTVAVPRRINREETDFISCVAWNKTAEFISVHFDKGSPIFIRGILQNRQWTDKNGEKKQSYEIVVDEAYFVEGREKTVPAGGEQMTVRPDVEMVEKAITPDSDLPF